MTRVQRQLNKPSHRLGFTLVELLIVIVIIGILAAITIIAYSGITAKARDSVAQADLAQIARKLETVKAENDTYPSTLTAAGIKNPADDGTSYDYVPATDLAGYCLSATNSNIIYHLSNDNQLPRSGGCETCPSGYILIPGNSIYGTSDFCVMKYEAQNDGAGNAVSVAGGAPYNHVNQTDAITYSAAACAGCHLITDAEWMTIAANVALNPANWTSGSVGTGDLYSGHNDGNPNNPIATSTSDSDGYYGEGAPGPYQKRTLILSNGNVIWDFSGNVWEWEDMTIAGTDAGGRQPGVSGQTGYQWLSWPVADAGFTLNFNSLSTLDTPASIGAQGAEWPGWSGVGGLFSNPTTTTTNGALRGGSYGDGTGTPGVAGGGAGAFALDFYAAPGTGNDATGFRVVAPVSHS